MSKDSYINCSNYINKIWKLQLDRFKFRYIYNPNYKGVPNQHIFLQDLNFVASIDKYQPKINKKSVENYSDFNINQYFIINNRNYIPKKKISSKYVNKLYRSLMSYKDIPKWSDLESKLASLYNYLLYSNIDINKYKETLLKKTPDTINILILGAGPTGLYLANYIKQCYFLSPKINLLVLDNRVINTNKGVRLPYTRNRIFGVQLDLFSPFFPKFPCIKELTKRGGIEIKYLENLLIVLTYGNNIPIYFTDEVINQSSLIKFVKDFNINVVFDCTGDRLKNNFIKNDTSNYFDKNVILSSDKYEVNVDVNSNEARLYWKDGMEDRYYLNIEVYDNKSKFLYSHYANLKIIYEYDYLLLSKLHNKCIKLKKNKFYDVSKIFDSMRDTQLSRYIKTSLLENENYYIKFYIVESQIYHKLLISGVIKNKGYECLYIGAGDTIFSSHYVIGAGLNRILNFMNQVVWSLQKLSTL